MDPNLTLAIEQVHATEAGTNAEVFVESFFDEPTNTVSYLIHDPVTKRGAVIDCIWNVPFSASKIRYPGKRSVNSAAARIEIPAKSD